MASRAMPRLMLLIVLVMSMACLPRIDAEHQPPSPWGLRIANLAKACFGLVPKNAGTPRQRAPRAISNVEYPSDRGPNGEEVLNVAAYRFVEIPEGELAQRREYLRGMLQRHSVRGTILLSREGINLFLAAPAPALRRVLAELRAVHGLQGADVKFSWSKEQPFSRSKVKLKREIIRMDIPTIRPGVEGRAPFVDPKTLNRWLDNGVDDEGREVVMLDTRNDYEVEYGTFDKAIDLNITTFSQLPATVEPLAGKLADKTVVSFCTGGIRCEKATIYMRQALSLDRVFQLDGGILGYFANEGGKHYKGGCFVFDQRGVLDSELRECRPEGFKLRDRLPKMPCGLV